jgi:hypothetical protein
LIISAPSIHFAPLEVRRRLLTGFASFEIFKLVVSM